MDASENTSEDAQDIINLTDHESKVDGSDFNTPDKGGTSHATSAKHTKQNLQTVPLDNDSTTKHHDPKCNEDRPSVRRTGE